MKLSTARSGVLELRVLRDNDKEIITAWEFQDMLHRHNNLMVDIAQFRLPFSSVPYEYSIVQNTIR